MTSPRDPCPLEVRKNSKCNVAKVELLRDVVVLADSLFPAVLAASLGSLSLDDTPAGMAAGRLSAEERDEVVAALAAEFKAGERERLSCWNAGRGSVCGVPFPGWEDWVREGRVLLFEGDLEELRSGPARGAGGGGRKSRDGRRRGARR